MTTATTGMALVNASQTTINNSEFFIQTKICGLFIRSSRYIVTSDISTNSAVSVEYCHNIILIFDIHIRNVTSKPALLVYRSSNITIVNTTFKEHGGCSVSDTTVSRAVVVLYSSRDLHFHNCTFRKNRVAISHKGSWFKLGIGWHCDICQQHSTTRSSYDPTAKECSYTC